VKLRELKEQATFFVALIMTEDGHVHLDGVQFLIDLVPHGLIVSVKLKSKRPAF